MRYTPELRAVNADNETILYLDSIQGMWTQDQYLQMTNHSRRLLEFTDGRLEVLPPPTDRHQSTLESIFLALHGFLKPRGGTVLFAPLRLQLREGKFREPDLLLLRDANDPRRQNAYWLGADLVLEVVSPDDPERDTRIKVADYAEAGIPECWVVNPADATITVLRLAGAEYGAHGVFRRGDTATSALLDGFAVAVDAALDAR